MVPTIADIRQRVAIRLFALGHLQFFTAFFITKYFDFAFYASYGLLILAGLQALSLWTGLWQPILSRHRFILYPTYLLCLLVLSFSSAAMPVVVICVAVLFIFSFVQSEIILLFKSPRQNIGYLYAAELAGGICGSLTWAFFSSKAGFFGFVVLGTVTSLFVLSREKPFRHLVPALLVAMVFLPFLGEPQPLFDKRERAKLISEGALLDTRWEPNGVVELVSGNPTLNLLLFDGGDLRSHIYRRIESFDELRASYNDSVSTGTWGLDVILPHFIHGKKSPQVALISTVGGQEILAARAFSAGGIDAIDINQSAQKIMNTGQKEFSGGIYDGVNVVNDDGRRFIERSEKNYDVIQMYSSDSAAFSSAFGSLLRPSSLITAEAIRIYDQHLVPDGILQITSAPLGKLVETFRAAFNNDLDTLSDRLFLYHRKGDNKLVSAAYKKNGWTVLEKSKISSWLRKDPRHQWVIKDFASVASTERAVDFTQRASTDNWPFFKVSSSEMFFERVGNVVIAAAALVLLFLWTLRRMTVQRDVVQPAFWMGVSYAMAQSFYVFLIQKQLGLPALGLSVGVAAVLLVTGLAAILANSDALARLTPKVSARVSMLLAIVLTPVFYLSGVSILVPLTLLVILQSIGFVRMLKCSISSINLVLWTNGLGCLLGVFLFNLSFAVFGLWQTVAVLSCVYFYLAFSVKTPVEATRPVVAL